MRAGRSYKKKAETNQKRKSKTNKQERGREREGFQTATHVCTCTHEYTHTQHNKPTKAQQNDRAFHESGVSVCVGVGTKEK